MEEIKKNEQENMGNSSKNEIMLKIKKIKNVALEYIKKPLVTTALSMILATIIALCFVFCGNERPETTNYLGDICYVPFGEMIVESATESTYYVTKEDAFIQAPSGKKVIRVYGHINNVSEKKQSLSSDMFRLNPTDSQEQKPKSYAFVDNYSSHFVSVTLPTNGTCQFYMYYIVDKDTILEDCRLIVYSAVVALTYEPLIV
ncbi:MAG: hypothetical protein IKL82_06105 [Clostridia bacterium]|nr:hypothetical protein [Clostridia bacterium]